MGGDKIVLLDGAGANGGGAATNGLLSMIPGMFANPEYRWSITPDGRPSLPLLFSLPGLFLGTGIRRRLLQ